MSSQTPATSADDAVLAVRLPAKLRDDFRVVAESNHRTMSGEVRHLVEQRVAQAQTAAELEDAA